MAKTSAEYAREWRQKNPERKRENNRRWAANNPDKVRAYREKMRAVRQEQNKLWKKANPDRVAASERRSLLKRKYGLTPEDYEALSASQDHRCAVCLQHRSEESRGILVIDHCHDTGRVRGLLCNDCNRNLIAQRTDPAIFYRAAEYLSG